MSAPVAGAPHAIAGALALVLWTGVALPPAVAQSAATAPDRSAATSATAPATSASATDTPPTARGPEAASGAARASAPAGTARPSADDPALEARVITVTRELRCLVCQNESIADSHAPLAVDMRNQIREQLRSGMSERDVIAFMVDRYGNFVRFRPPLAPSTLALWFGPLVLMVGGLLALGLQLRRRARRLPPPSPLRPEEAARLAALAGDDAADRLR